MPRFGFGTDLRLIDLPGGLGLRLPFVPCEAELGGVTKGGRLSKHGALHKAAIAVYERGTGAAATAILAMPVSGGGGRRR